MTKISDIARWRTEIELATDFRDKNFGMFSPEQITKAGENIEYFERGMSVGNMKGQEDVATTLNFFHTIVKLIVPSLYYRNPQITVVPLRREDEASAPYARAIINHYYKQLDVDCENELTIWDAYVTNRGVSKVGYATKFGMDVPDETPAPKKTLNQRVKEALGLSKDETEVIKPEINQNIKAESPYTKYVSPFNFLMDPRAMSLNDAMWVGEEFDKTVAELKRNKKYKNTGSLKGANPDRPEYREAKVPETAIEEFSVVRLYQLHYINDGKMYQLVIVKDGSVYKELYHEETIYEMDEFQYDLIEFTRHGHLQFKRGDLDKIKNLQDRFTSTIDSILEQLDRFVPKIAIDASNVSPAGKQALENGDIGAIIECQKNPSEVIREVALSQYKSDLKAILEEMINLITIMTGITRSKLLGVSPSSETATGANIAQGGENIRMDDMSKAVQRFSNKQAKKLWKVITQFVDLKQLNLITGETGVDPQTGAPMYSWLEINDEMAGSLINGQYQFDMEVGSTQKIDSALISKRLQELLSIIARTDVIALMQQQGQKVNLGEILRLWLQNNPEIVRDTGKIIQNVGPQTQGLLPAEQMLMGGQGGMTNGSLNNQAAASAAAPMATPQSLMSEAAQI